MIVHLGVVLIAVGMAASSAYLRDSEFSLAPGQSATLGDHTVTYLGLQTVERSEKRSYVAAVQIDGGPIYEPSINLFRSTGQSVGEPSVRSSWKDDVYLTLEQPLPGDDGVAVIRVIVQPLVVWLWIGGALMALGTVLAAFPGRRRRRPTDPVSAPADAPPASDRGRVPAEVAG